MMMASKSPKILITGGAGYVGSHCVRVLQDAGYETIVLDNLSLGHKEAVTGELVVGDLANRKLLDKLFSENNFEAVMHFAASMFVGESMEKPAKYFRNNVVNSLNLLETMVRHDVRKLVFSSTAAVYGNVEDVPISEDAPKDPTSVYGESKLMMEKMMKWFDETKGLNFMALRYFNCAGDHPSGKIGQDQRPFQHIIPIACEAAMGLREDFTIFGEDYETPDGTCVRDYIYVMDLARAHLKAFKALLDGSGSDVFNIGTGQGYSVKEIVEKVKEVSGEDFKVKKGKRRAGDPPVLVADPSKIKRELGWEAEHGLEIIVETAWDWHSSHPKGYQT